MTSTDPARSAAQSSSTRRAWLSRAGSATVAVIGLAAVAALYAVTHPKTAWDATVLGQPVRFVIVRPDSARMGLERAALPRPLPCVIEINIDPAFMNSTGADNYLAWLTAHEFAHCLDRRVLGSDHNGLTATELDTDHAPGDPDRAAAETFADAYAAAYLKRCGPLLAPLGWPVDDGACTPPDPRSVTAYTNPMEVMSLPGARVRFDYATHTTIRTETPRLPVDASPVRATLAARHPAVPSEDRRR